MNDGCAVGVQRLAVHRRLDLGDDDCSLLLVVHRSDATGRASPLPSTGIGRCNVNACCPCTSSAGLNVPILPIGEPLPQPMTTGKVGNTCCCDAVGVLGRERQLLVAGPDADGVQQGVLARPARFGGIRSPRRRRPGSAACQCSVSLVRHVGCVCGHVPGPAVHPRVQAGVGEQLGDHVAELCRVVDRVRRRTTDPSFGDRRGPDPMLRRHDRSRRLTARRRAT